MKVAQLASVLLCLPTRGGVKESRTYLELRDENRSTRKKDGVDASLPPRYAVFEQESPMCGGGMPIDEHSCCVLKQTRLFGPSEELFTDSFSMPSRNEVSKNP